MLRSELAADVLIAVFCLCDLKDLLRIEQVSFLSFEIIEANLHHADMPQVPRSCINQTDLAVLPSPT